MKDKFIQVFPKTFEYIWGGNKLREYNIESNASNIAEAWIFSFNVKGLSFDKNNNNLKDILDEKFLGRNYDKFSFFPFLIKLINSEDSLSIQVHPSDDYALKNENSYGKTEMWYILEAEPNSYLYLGLNNNYTPEQVKNAIEDGSICNLLNKVNVKPGDCYFVKSGTIHAIGKGITLIEIQQNSALTYRLYDFDRKDKNGNKRELHVEKALKVIDFNKYVPSSISSNPLGDCEYFTVEKHANEKVIKAPKHSALVVSFVKGSGTVNKEKFAKGNTFILKANSKIKVTGSYEAVTTYVK